MQVSFINLFTPCPFYSCCLFLLLFFFSASLSADVETSAIGNWQLKMQQPSDVQFFGPQDILLTLREQDNLLVADWKWGRKVENVPVRIVNNEIIIHKDTVVNINGEDRPSFTVIKGKLENERWIGSIQLGENRVLPLNGEKMP